MVVPGPATRPCPGAEPPTPPPPRAWAAPRGPSPPPRAARAEVSPGGGQTRCCCPWAAPAPAGPRRAPRAARLFPSFRSSSLQPLPRCAPHPARPAASGPSPGPGGRAWPRARPRRWPGAEGAGGSWAGPDSRGARGSRGLPSCGGGRAMLGELARPPSPSPSPWFWAGRGRPFPATRAPGRLPAPGCAARPDPERCRVRLWRRRAGGQARGRPRRLCRADAVRGPHAWVLGAMLGR